MLGIERYQLFFFKTVYPFYYPMPSPVHQCDLLRPPPLSGRRPGVTLIELLIVIVIVGILTAVLIPGISSIRETAHITKCTVNMRSLWMGMELYAQNNQDFYPSPQRPAGVQGRDFVERLVLGGFMEDNKEAGACPSDPAMAGGRVLMHEGPRSYFLMSPSMSPAFVSSNARNRSSFANPARVGMITEFHSGESPAVARTLSGGNTGFPVGWDIVATDVRARTTVGHRDGARNVVFADGHVAFLTVGEMRRIGTVNAELWGVGID